MSNVTPGADTAQPPRLLTGPALETALRGRLEAILGGTIQPIVLNALASETADVVQSWLTGRSYDEVYDGEGYYALRRAADMTKEPR